MGRIVAVLAAVLVVALGIAGIRLYDAVVGLEAESVTEDVWVVFGLGGNVGVLRTEVGAVVVDSMTFRMQGKRIRELAERLTGGPTQALLNTHYHVDHSHGNPGFAPGTRVVSTQRTLDYMLGLDAGAWQGAAADTLPNDVFETEHELRIGEKTIRALHVGPGHTGGDMVVLLVEDRVLHAGDLFFNGRYPNIDLEAGGSIREWIGTLDRVLALDFDRVIPGHGPVTDRQGILAFQRFLEELWALGQAAAAEGLTLDETLAQKDLEEDEGYGVIGVPFVFRLDRDFVIRRAWEEATGSVVPVDVPRAQGGSVDEGSVLGGREAGARHRRLSRHRADDRPGLRGQRREGLHLVAQGRRLRGDGRGALGGGHLRGAARGSLHPGGVRPPRRRAGLA